MWKLFGHHVWNDLRHGVIGQWKKYAIACAVIVFICFQYLPVLEFAHQTGNVPLSFGDYLFYVLKGMAVIRPEEMDPEINVFWILYNFMIVFIVSYYPFKDLAGYGQQILLRSRKRSFWWLSKCIWAVTCVLIYYLLTYCIISIFVLFTGGNFSIFLQCDISQTNALNIKDAGVLLLIGIALPVAASVSLSLLQLVLSLILKPILSIMIILALIVLSIFICSDWAIGNYTMVARSSYMIAEGVDPTNGLIIMGTLSVCSVLAGLFVFKRKNIFSH